MFLIPILLFLINPFLCILCFAVYLNYQKIIQTKLFYFFYFLLAIFLGFINMTKIPESDLAYHASGYTDARGVTIYQYLLSLKFKEFIFYAYNYIFYYLSGGSVKFWILTISFLGYFPFFIAIHRFQVKISAKPYYVIFAICLAAFFPQLFSLSAHLIRQFIAGSIALYFLVDKLVYKKNKWWLIIFGAFIHSSSIILFIFGFMPFLKERPNLFNASKYIVFGLILGGYQILSKSLLSTFSDTAGIGYALERASKNTTFELAAFNVTNYIFIIILSYLLIKKVYVNNLDKKINGVEFIANIIFIQIFFILTNIDQSELSNRLFFYLCFFFPLIIPLQLQQSNYGILRKILTLFLIVFFAYRLMIGTWHYATIAEIISSNFFDFILRKEFSV